ncbi:MAG TPA: HAD family hydrolase [Polyangiaceae bacterium]
MTYRGVLLDIDGTFLDSNDAHAGAFADAIAEEKLDVPFARVRPLIGMGSDKLLPALGIQPESRVAAHVKRRKKEIFRTKYLPRLGPCPGARDLLAHMKALEMKLVVATSAPNEELDQLLRAGKIADLIDHEATSSDADDSKPDPDIVEAAITKSKLGRETLIMIGDTPYDVEAATRAHVPIIALRCGGWKDDELKGAIEIFDDPRDLLVHFDASALAQPPTTMRSGVFPAYVAG